MPVSFLQWFKVALQESNQSGNFHNWSYFYQKNVKSTECKNFNATGGRYHQCSTYNFYARGAQKRKMTMLTWLSVFALLGSTCVKAVRRTLMKLSSGLCAWLYHHHCVFHTAALPKKSIFVLLFMLPSLHVCLNVWLISTKIFS